MAQEYAKNFYESKAWKECRKSYIKSVGGLCEDCLAKGIYKPGIIVHHIKHITPENITDVSITLNWNNLRYVCRDCHGEEHSNKGNRRYYVDEAGNVIIKGL